jgi:hypothetical protein
VADEVEIITRGRDAGAAGLLESIDGRLGKLAGMGGAIGGAFGRMGSAMMSPFTMITGALGKILTLQNMMFAGAGGMLVKSVIDYADAIDEAAAKTGMSREALQALQLQATLNKSSFADVTRGLILLGQNTAVAARGEGQQAAAFAELGVKATNADGTLRSVDAVLEDVAEGLKNCTNDTKRLELVSALFGARMSASMLPMLVQGREGIRAYREELTKRHMKMSDEQIKQLAELKDKLAELRAQGMSMLAQIFGGGAGAEASKGIEAIMEKLAALAASGALDEFAKKLVGAISTVSQKAIEFVGWVRENGDWLATLGISAVGVKMTMDMSAALFSVAAALKTAGAARAAGAVGTGGKLMGQVGIAAAVAGAGFAAGQWLSKKTGFAGWAGEKIYAMGAGRDTTESERAVTAEELEQARAMREHRLAAMGNALAAGGAVAGPAEAGGATTTNNSTTVNRAVSITGPVTVVAQDPEELADELERPVGAAQL